MPWWGWALVVLWVAAMWLAFGLCRAAARGDEMMAEAMRRREQQGAMEVLAGLGSAPDVVSSTTTLNWKDSTLTGAGAITAR